MNKSKSFPVRKASRHSGFGRYQSSKRLRRIASARVRRKQSRIEVGSQADTIRVSDLLAVKEFVDSVGSIELAKAYIRAVAS